MKIKKQLIKRDIAGDTILVPVGKTVYDSKGLFVMNEIASFIWDKLPDANGEEEIVNALLEAYEVTREEAFADTVDFLKQLREMNIIE